MLEGILAASTILGGAVAALELWKAVQEKQGRFGWRRVTSAVKKLIIKIQQANYQPDLIVGLGRGGFVVAGMLSGNMGIVTLAGLDRRYLWEGQHRRVKIVDLGSLDVAGKKILLIVAEPYTGETLRKGYEYLKERDAKQVKTAALFKAELCNFVPDFYAYDVKHVTHLPWRLTDLYARDSKDPQHHAKYLDDEGANIGDTPAAQERA
jgi:hypoxanthine phosphoribosyltransferase